MAYGMNKLTDKKLRALLGTKSERESKISDGAGLTAIRSSGPFLTVYAH
ncbi:hypothetical protein Q5A_008445 [Serratia inhibens PRI-2C]|nr:hypothetical protein Q5A_008445 [Serratia inhibens PRI-2C]